MPRKYKPKPTKLWNDNSLQRAVTENAVSGTSIRKLSEKYSIPKSTLHFHLSLRKRNLKPSGQGCKPVFTNEENEELKTCIVQLAELGFAPSITDLREIVFNYVQQNDLEHAQKRLKYNGNKGYPGPDWIAAFLERNQLSLKNATKLSVARYNATKNPFIIYHYYEMLEDCIQKLGLEDRPDLIWNMDESGLPHEPKKCKVISQKGQKTLQVVPGSNRENTTVVAACSASGTKLPPMIIFEGKQVQTTWRPDRPSNSPNYPWIYSNKKGWMDTDTFFKWFEQFEETTRTYKEVYNKLTYL